MKAALLKNHIYIKVKKLTEEQLLLVDSFVELLEKAIPQKNNIVYKKEKTQAVNNRRDMTAVYELQKLFQGIAIPSLVEDVILEREDRK